MAIRMQVVVLAAAISTASILGAQSAQAATAAAQPHAVIADLMGSSGNVIEVGRRWGGGWGNRGYWRHGGWGPGWRGGWGYRRAWDGGGWGGRRGWGWRRGWGGWGYRRPWGWGGWGWPGYGVGYGGYPCGYGWGNPWGGCPYYGGYGYGYGAPVVTFGFGFGGW